ncbi:MAG: ABC transporter ATP-binding protein [Promethearchaeota archaeon]|nr:MAG: ABC transporter ATP-binding protein [Candidatus Lokiarchaeota archaeon]
MSEKDKNKKEEAKIREPTAFGRHRGPPMLMGEKSKLEHPRKDLWKFLFSYLIPHKSKLIIFLILLLASTVVQSFYPVLVSLIIDNGIVLMDADYIRIMSTMFLSLMIFMGIANYIAQYGMGRASQKVVFEVRNDIFSKLQEMSLGYFDTRPSGDILSIATNDVDQLNNLVGGQFVQIITSMVGLGLTIVFMYVLNPFLATLSLVVFPIFLILLKLFKKVVTGAFKESRKAISKVTSSIQENIAGAKVVQAYGQEESATSEFDRANKANFDIMVKVRRIMSTFFPFTMCITTIITVSIITIGGFSILNSVEIFGAVITVGVLSAFITILAQFFRPFMTLMQIQQIIESALASVDRIESLLEESVEIPDKENPENLNEVQGNVKFSEVNFGYNVENGNGKGEETKVAQNPMEMMMAQNPMIKNAFEKIKSFPEPYSSFMLKNTMNMPQEIRMQLFMKLMRAGSSKAPEIIDDIFAEFGYAVPNTEMAKNHPEFKTRFKRKSAQMPPQSMLGNKAKEHSEKKVAMDKAKGMQFTPNPQMITMMAKGLERMLSSKPSSSGSMGGDTGGMMGGAGGGLKMPGMNNPQGLARMMASMPIPPEIFEKFPKVVKDYIKEQKILLEHEQTRGYILKEMDFKIDAGSTVAIVGETGAGKTTTIKLIARFYDVNKGSITIDGHDIRNVTKRELRDLIGLVPQDAFIFTGTIKENLLYAFDEITPEIEEKMIEISKFLGLHNFIETLHKKYDTKLKENGSNISIGQRQLIAFARALLTDPKILILDEATSSVDPYTESLIQDALDKARKGRTTIIIAHRLSTIKNADHIIVIGKEKKGILEEGNHEELMSLNGAYKHLINMQHRDLANL